eukprot:12933821-Prorocentrum_lima.AAC.1
MLPSVDNFACDVERGVPTEVLPDFIHKANLCFVRRIRLNHRHEARATSLLIAAIAHRCRGH